APARLAVGAEAVDPRRLAGCVEVDPDAVDLDAPARIAGERPAPPGGECGNAAAPRGQRNLTVVEERAHDGEAPPPHEPEVLRHPPVRLLHVVDRHVLE